MFSRYTKYIPPKTFEAQVRDNPEVAVPIKKDVTIETIANKLVTMKKVSVNVNGGLNPYKQLVKVLYCKPPTKRGQPEQPPTNRKQPEQR